MERPKFRDIGIKWPYWFVATGWTAGSAALIWFALSISENTKSDRQILDVCGAFFVTVGLLIWLWPFLRRLERQGIRQTRLRSNGRQYDGVFVPASLVKITMMLIGALIFGSAGLWLVVHSNTISKDTVEGAIASLAYIVGFVFAIRSCTKYAQGILLCPDGIVWHEVFRAPSLIPWNEIARVQQFKKQGEYGTSDAIGICVVNVQSVVTTPKNRKKMIDDANRYGSHFHYGAETLLLPLTALESIIHFYAAHAELRRELATSETIRRFTVFDAESTRTYPITS